MRSVSSAIEVEVSTETSSIALIPSTGWSCRKPERLGNEVAGEGAGHDEIAMREIDQAQYAVNHGVAKCDLRIDRTDGQAEHHEIDPLRGVVAGLHEGTDGARNDYHHDQQAQCPKHHVHCVHALHSGQPRCAGCQSLAHLPPDLSV